MSTSILSARHFFVVNPVCFYNRMEMDAIITEIHDFFSSMKNPAVSAVAEYDIHVSRFPRDAIWAIQSFANAAPPWVPLRVYAVGGRGTLFDCLNGIVELTNVELGIMPYGKETNFYPVFGVKNKNVFSLLEMQISASSVYMDVLHCGSNYALSHCTIGLEAFANDKRARKGSAFLDRCMSVFFHALNINSMHLTGIVHPELLRQNYRIWVDDEYLNGKYAFINISNGPCYTRNKHDVILEADPTDGWLDMLVCNEVSVLKSYNVFNKYINGNHAKYPHLITCRRAKKIFLSSANPFMFDLDGEIFYDKHISIEVKPKKVRIISPSQIYQE
jgi:diacylglycerol kinase family enzyme